jgi:hypothetical protein
MSEPGLQVVVKFPKEVPLDAQGEALLSFEQTLRRLTKLDVRVVKDIMTDDSKWRRLMSVEQREKL